MRNKLYTVIARDASGGEISRKKFLRLAAAKRFALVLVGRADSQFVYGVGVVDVQPSAEVFFEDTVIIRYAAEVNNA